MEHKTRVQGAAVYKVNKSGTPSPRPLLCPLPSAWRQEPGCPECLPLPCAMLALSTSHDFTHSALASQNNLKREVYFYLRFVDGETEAWALCPRSQGKQAAELGSEPTAPMLITLTTPHTALSQLVPKGPWMTFSRVRGKKDQIKTHEGNVS